MARGTQLINLVSMLRAEAGLSTKVSVGTDQEDTLKTKIRRIQETYYDEVDWPFLRIFPTKALAAGQQFYDWPAALNPERVNLVKVKYGSRFYPLERGITLDDYNAHDSAADDRSEPALKWDIRFTGTTDQLEIWPLPVTNDMVLYFDGIQKLAALTSNSDTAMLDDLLIVLTGAAELLARKETEDAKILAKSVGDRLTRLKGRLVGDRPTRVMGGETPPLRRPQTVIQVR